MNKGILLVLLFSGISIWGFAQNVAIKTNLLYGAYTYTPKLSLEVGLGRRSTFDFGMGYN